MSLNTCWWGVEKGNILFCSGSVSVLIRCYVLESLEWSYPSEILPFQPVGHLEWLGPRSFLPLARIGSLQMLLGWLVLLPLLQHLETFVLQGKQSPDRAYIISHSVLDPSSRGLRDTVQSTKTGTQAKKTKKLIWLVNHRTANKTFNNKAEVKYYSWGKYSKNYNIRRMNWL